MLNNVKAFADAYNDGKTWLASWRKQPTQATGPGVWFDLSMSPGNPIPNYYAAAPNVSVALRQSTDGGIPHGSAVAPAKKYLKQFTMIVQSANAVPMPVILCDYLLFYPFVDMSVTGEQPMVNAATLPRSSDGKGVKILPVVVAGHLGANSTRFFVTYTNEKGESGRQTPICVVTTQILNGTIATCGNLAPSQQGTSPFMPLQQGDTGVRSIDSVTFLDSDIGLLAFVLVKPVENSMMRTIDAPSERNCFTDMCSMPVIDDDAYLNLLVCPQSSLSGVHIHGLIETIWE